MQRLRIAIKKTDSPVVYCAVTAGTGTRNETPQYNGLAHFTEHMLFKGTSKRGSVSINNCLENVGGELNAYTTKEETVIYATVLKEDMGKAINLLLELALDSVFPPDQIKKEREVVYDEIISYKDSPAEAICDEFETIFFGDHPLSMPILGTKETLRKINRETFKDYIDKNFLPDNLALSVVGNACRSTIANIVGRQLKKYVKEPVELQFIEEGKLYSGPDAEYGDKNDDSALAMAAVKEDCKGYRQGQEPELGKDLDLNQEHEIKRGDELATGVCFDKTIHKKGHQVHCVTGASAYSWQSKKRLALALLTNMLGGPSSNSRLNYSLREKNGLVYNVEANYTPFADTGLVTIYFGCDKQYLDDCIKLVEKELDLLIEKPMADTQLKKIKKQFIGQLSISLDNAESQALSMGKSMLVYNKIASFEDIKCSVEKLTADYLYEVAKEIFDKKRFSRLIYQ